jgi:succinate dehydrogenase flavin-adding protein (antitoxin of CptAB toxin-antitoxin module)
MSSNGTLPPGGADIEDEVAVKRLRWRSRRGMLELELALKPFVDSRLESLSPAEQARYARLLEHDDWDIFDWVQGKREPEDAELRALVEEIRAAAAA